MGEDETNVKILDGTVNPRQEIQDEGQRHKRANMFLDSGATESSYVRQDVINAILRSHTNKKNFLKHNPTNACGAFGQCQLSSHSIVLLIDVPAPFGMKLKIRIVTIIKNKPLYKVLCL